MNNLLKSRVAHYWANATAIIAVLASDEVLRILPENWTPYVMLIATLVAASTGFKVPVEDEGENKPFFPPRD